MACASCGRGIKGECECQDSGTSTEASSEFVSRRRDGEITVSAGRKRAAVDYPLVESMPCEWRNMANCGGGPSPIVGCITGLQKNRHHGPDKNTANNDPGNVHRICPHCHNRWHAANDKYYDGKVAKFNLEEFPHDPRPATLEELAFRKAESHGNDSPTTV